MSVVPALIISCALVALLSSRRILKPYGIPSHCATAMIVAGLAILFFTPAGIAEKSPFFLMIAGIFCGAGFGALVIAWRETFVYDVSQHHVRHIIVASLFGAALCSVLAYVSFYIAAPVSIISVIVADYLLCKMRQENTIRRAPRKNMTRKVLSLILTSLLFVCVLEFLYTSSSQIALEGSDGFAANRIFNIAILAASLLLFALVKIKENSFDSVSLYDIIFFVVGGALLFLPFLGTDWGIFLASFIVACTQIVSVIIVVAAVSAIRDLDANALTIHSIIEICIQGSCYAGVLLTSPLRQAGFGSVQLLLISFAGIYLMGMALAVMVRRLSMKQTAEPAGPTIESLAVAKLDSEQKAELAKLAESIFEEKCGKISKQGRLTPRESEVLLYLAKGESVEQISKDLTVSINTIKTHAKMVYAKLDVHSRQELINLLREVS